MGQLGYMLMVVPFWEWIALRGEDAERRYLEEQAHGEMTKEAGGWPTRGVRIFRM